MPGKNNTSSTPSSSSASVDNSAGIAQFTSTVSGYISKVDLGNKGAGICAEFGLPIVGKKPAEVVTTYFTESLRVVLTKFMQLCGSTDVALCGNAVLVLTQVHLMAFGIVKGVSGKNKLTLERMHDNKASETSKLFTAHQIDKEDIGHYLIARGFSDKTVTLYIKGVQKTKDLTHWKPLALSAALGAKNVVSPLEGITKQLFPNSYSGKFTLEGEMNLKANVSQGLCTGADLNVAFAAAWRLDKVNRAKKGYSCIEHWKHFETDPARLEYVKAMFSSSDNS